MLGIVRDKFLDWSILDDLDSGCVSPELFLLRVENAAGGASRPSAIWLRIGLAALEPASEAGGEIASVGERDPMVETTATLDESMVLGTSKK